MSCRECDENQLNGAFYRWKNANIEIVGCEEHIKEVMNALSVFQLYDEKLKQLQEMVLSGKFGTKNRAEILMLIADLRGGKL